MPLKPKNNFENMTFGELDTFVNEWIVKTQDMEDIFINQSDEMNRLFLVVGSHHDKMRNINHRLNIVRYLQAQLENILSVSTQNYKLLLERVLCLEKQTAPLCDKSVVQDKLREKIYGTAEDIHTILTNNENKLDGLTLGILKMDALQIDEPAELIARILMRQMYNLEGIEENISKLLNLIQVIHCKMTQFCRA